jgi:hypothetical protein
MTNYYKLYILYITHLAISAGLRRPLAYNILRLTPAARLLHSEAYAGRSPLTPSFQGVFSIEELDF